MAHREPTRLPIAVRVFPVLESTKQRRQFRKIGRRPKAILVIDTESCTDASQKLMFGSSRLFVEGRCLEEVLFYADDLQETDRLTLELYVAEHPADTVREGAKQIRLMPRREFVEYLFKLAYKARVWVVGFNLPFDLSRLGISVSPARGFFAGGFTFALSSYTNPKGKDLPDSFRPRVRIKHIDSKRALIDFAARSRGPPVDRSRKCQQTNCRPALHYGRNREGASQEHPLKIGR